MLMKSSGKAADGWLIRIMDNAISAFSKIFAVCAALAFCMGYAPAAVSDCIEQGGLAVCSKPQVGKWIYRLCDEAGPYVFRYRAWCEVAGGTYLGVNAGCVGDSPHAESNLFSRSVGFANNVYPPPSRCTGTGDTGWGQTISSNLCFSGGPRYNFGILIDDYRTISVSCSPSGGETIRAGRWRDLVCPVGTSERNIGSQTVCVHRWRTPAAWATRFCLQRE